MVLGCVCCVPHNVTVPGSSRRQRAAATRVQLRARHTPTPSLMCSTLTREQQDPTPTAGRLHCLFVRLAPSPLARRPFPSHPEATRQPPRRNSTQNTNATERCPGAAAAEQHLAALLEQHLAGLAHLNAMQYKSQMPLICGANSKGQQALFQCQKLVTCRLPKRHDSSSVE